MNPVGGYSLNNDEDEDGRIGETSTEELIVPLIKDSFIVSSPSRIISSNWSYILMIWFE